MSKICFYSFLKYFQLIFNRRIRFTTKNDVSFSSRMLTFFSVSAISNSSLILKQLNKFWVLQLSFNKLSKVKLRLFLSTAISCLCLCLSVSDSLSVSLAPSPPPLSFSLSLSCSLSLSLSLSLCLSLSLSVYVCLAPSPPLSLSLSLSLSLLFSIFICRFLKYGTKFVFNSNYVCNAAVLSKL